MVEDERKLDKYKIIKELDSGSFGTVYRVKQISNNKIYALKESKYEQCQSFSREISALNKISIYKKKQDENYKSYTINMIENFEEEDEIGQKLKYIVLEYMPNKSLFEYFYNNIPIFSEICAKYLFSKIVKGVQEIHNSGLCHLDLKLNNILLDEKYNPIICDFGFCMDSSKPIKRFFYSPGYAPKEIYKRKAFDGIKADIFSLGVVLFYIVTNRSIFKNSKMFSKYYNPNYDKYIDEDKYYLLIKNKENDEFWKVVIGEELNLSVEFKDLVINMIAYEPNERLSIEQIINHPWLEEINKLTVEDKNKLEERVKKELKELYKIKNGIYKNNYANKNYLSDDIKNYISKNKSGSAQDKEDIFAENFILENIDEDDLDMKYHFKIDGLLSPKKFMNLLYYQLSELKNNKDDDNRLFFIQPSGKDFEIDIKFENDNEEIIEEFQQKGIEEEDFEDLLRLLDLEIGVKLFKAQNGYLIKVFRKNGTYEDFYLYLGKIMNLIKELFNCI